MHATTTSTTGTYPMPELAAACRALLATVDLADRWHDDGPDPTAAAWLASAAQCCPEGITADQWTMLRVCAGIWQGQGGASTAELLSLGRVPMLAVGRFYQAFAYDAMEAWSAIG